LTRRGHRLAGAVTPRLTTPKSSTKRRWHGRCDAMTAPRRQL
jgi:hypothetical protein